ncbi:hypothetical protein J1D01_10530 [Seonamhaeicola sp. NFXS20]|uniref:hypothetical protein n=1 Tax=Seonamhaeicola sp. NFXS20 TaxID=2816959 RepID=UPI003B8B0C30
MNFNVHNTDKIMRCPFLDKNQKALDIGDEIIGSSNTDEVKGIVTFFDTGRIEDDYNKWLITVTHHKVNNEWKECDNYTLHLAYHLNSRSTLEFFSKV